MEPTLDMIYDELKSIKKKLNVVEHAIIPTEKLSAAELEKHKKDLKDALYGEKTNFRNL
ncbi:MAG: hypothetical protein ABIH83_05210 [Candidatus Micrarchaeota archaeon]